MLQRTNFAARVAHSALARQRARTPCPGTSYFVAACGELVGLRRGSTYPGEFEMFDRSNRTEGPLSVEIVLEDGRNLKGKLMVPAGRTLVETLNSSATFFEFEPMVGERMFIAKSALRTVKPLNVPAAPRLGPQGADGAFDPFAVLGVTPQTPREEVHHAYLNLSKIYHPDRYATAELPEEVRHYLSAMASRINAAHDALEEALQRQAAKQEPVFTSTGRP